MKKTSSKSIIKQAWRFVVLTGIVSLLADMTHEGARSLNGQFLSYLGASAAVVGFVAGFGELMGNGLRMLSGYVADKTKQYWTVTFVGYAINLLAVPMLALAGSWHLAALLMITERIGRAIRKPARDVMLSHATSNIGHGKGFGIHEAMDQIGAVAGPLIVGWAYYKTYDFAHSYLLLLVPALMALAVLTLARINFPRTEHLNNPSAKPVALGQAKTYWLYIAAVSLIAIGFADYPLIAFHFDKAQTVQAHWIPMLYAVAMGVDALAALALGHLFDRIGLKAVVLSTVLSLGFAPMVFFGGLGWSLAGMVLWGIGMAAQESVVRAFLASLLPEEKKATGFGVFYTVYGLAWFAGSYAMGLLYGASPVWVVTLSVAAQAAALPILLTLTFKNKHHIPKP